MPVEIGRLLTAMLTPFKSDGSVDYEAAEKLAVLLVADGSDGVVVSGTTGESPALSDDEKIELLKAIKKAIPRHSVVAGTGSNDTHHAVDLPRLAMKARADALLAVVPYYSKPPQDGMYQHFKAISEVGPTIMYNIQGRTAINMSAATTLRCAQLPGIIGVKEASGDLDQIGLVCAGKPERFKVWSGDDSWTLPLLAVGGDGVICVVSHIAGRSMKNMIDAYERADNQTATKIHQGLLPVIKTLMTTAANPVPIKSALNAMGFPAGPFRLPLVPLTDEQLQSVMKTVREAPGFNEDRQGEPFVGAAGKLLDTLLARIGLSRTDVFITNVLKCRPPMNRDPMPNEAESCSPYLKRQLALVKPRVVLILGRHALERLMPGQGSITRVHGTLVMRGGVAYVPLYHPAAALHNGSLVADLEHDFDQLKRYLDQLLAPPPPPVPVPAPKQESEQLRLL